MIICSHFSPLNYLLMKIIVDNIIEALKIIMGPKKNKGAGDQTDYEKLMATFMEMRQSEWDYYGYKRFLKCPPKVEMQRRTKLGTQMKNSMCRDILKLMTKKDLNDVTIELEDGELKANKVILMARSKYFSTMLGNKAFKETQEKVVDMKTVKKALMEKAIRYLYAGDIDIKGLDKFDVLKLLDLLRQLMLDNAFKWVSSVVEEPFDYNYEESRTCEDLDAVIKDWYFFVFDTIEKVVDLKLEDLTNKYLDYIAQHTHEIIEEKEDTLALLRSGLTGVPTNIFKMIAPLEIKNKYRFKAGETTAKEKLVKMWIEVNKDRLEDTEKEDILKSL